MLSKDQFGVLQTDCVASQDFIQIAHNCDTNTDFVCHHNSYLVAGFLRRLGYNCRWVTGFYRADPPAPPIHHSWIEFKAGDRLALVFEFDPRQVHDRGNYENDLMPSGRIPETSLRLSPVAIIVDPELVELPDDEFSMRFVVASKDVLSRYVQDRSLTPMTIDYDHLDELADEAQAYYEDMLENFGKSDSE